MNGWRPLRESVFLPALKHRVRYLPARTFNQSVHRIEDIRGYAWRLKHVDLPYWARTASREDLLRWEPRVARLVRRLPESIRQKL